MRGRGEREEMIGTGSWTEERSCLSVCLSVCSDAKVLTLVTQRFGLWAFFKVSKRCVTKVKTLTSLQSNRIGSGRTCTCMQPTTNPVEIATAQCMSYEILSFLLFVCHCLIVSYFSPRQGNHTRVGAIVGMVKIHSRSTTTTSTIM